MRKKMEITDIKVSYTILTHNETTSLKKLLESINKHKTMWDEVIIADDYSDNLETIKILSWAQDELGFKVFRNKLNGDFAQQKNFAASHCTNDYIFNIDADEIMPDFFMEHFKEILFLNSEVEMYRLPRINIVDGITLKHIEQWRWQITHLPTEIDERKIIPGSDEYNLLKAYNLILDENDGNVKFLKPLINAPDYQGRIYKKADDIQWTGEVHERLTGFKKFSNFPFEINYSIIHNKQISKQELQNSMYNEIIKGKM
jgi:glycosyltransferase involved in cell wall biosynthesis